MVYKLLKVLYGLKQAPRLWYKHLSKFLFEKLSLHQINTDHNIFMIEAGIKDPIVSIFINDIKVMRVKESGVIQKMMTELAAAFEIVDMGSINFYLSLKSEKNRIK